MSHLPPVAIWSLVPMAECKKRVYKTQWVHDCGGLSSMRVPNTRMERRRRKAPTGAYFCSAVPLGHLTSKSKTQNADRGRKTKPWRQTGTTPDRRVWSRPSNARPMGGRRTLRSVSPIGPCPIEAQESITNLTIEVRFALFSVAGSLHVQSETGGLRYNRTRGDWTGWGSEKVARMVAGRLHRRRRSRVRGADSPAGRSPPRGGARVLDVGTGEGQVARLGVKAGAAVVGLDPPGTNSPRPRSVAGDRRTSEQVPLRCRFQRRPFDVCRRLSGVRAHRRRWTKRLPKWPECWSRVAGSSSS